MASKLVFLLLLSVSLFADTLVLTHGKIQAHTKVFGDASIDPSVEKIFTDLSIKGHDLSTISGKIWFRVADLKSSNHRRDEHMYKMFDAKRYNSIALAIEHAVLQGEGYVIDGMLTMHGQTRPVRIPVMVSQLDNGIQLDAKFSVKVSDYGMQPPKLLFLTVRDRVDIHALLAFSRQ